MFEFKGITTEPYNPDAENLKKIKKGEEKMEKLEQIQKLNSTLDELKKIIEEMKEKRIVKMNIQITLAEGDKENV